MDMNASCFLTFDIDWAADEMIADCLAILEQQKVAATFFITHESPILQKIRSTQGIELGIHPNFNNLSGINNATVSQVLQQLKATVPEAVSARSHSLVQSSCILDEYAKLGITHEVNLYISRWSSMEISPFKHWNGMLRVPFFWEDDVHCTCINTGIEQDWDVRHFLDYKGLKVFNFHPIHVFLNTEHLDRYEKSRIYHNNISKLRDFCCPETRKGTRYFFHELIREAKKRNMTFRLIREVQL